MRRRPTPGTAVALCVAMDHNLAIAVAAPAPSHLRLAELAAELVDDEPSGDGPTHVFSPDPSYRGPGAETSVTASSVSEPAPRAPVGGHLDVDADDVAEVLEGRLDLVIETNPKATANPHTAVAMVPADRTQVTTPVVPSARTGSTAVGGRPNAAVDRSGTQRVERPILRTPDGAGTQIVERPILRTPDGAGTQLVERPILRTPDGVAVAVAAVPTVETAPRLGVPVPIAFDRTDVGSRPIRAARVVIAGRYLAGGDDVSEQTHHVGSSLLLARTPTSPFCDDPYVDAQHGALTFRPDGVAIEDFDSTNGVFVRVRDRATLRCGDLFRAGEELLRFTALRGSRAAGRAPSLGSPDPGYWGRIDVMIDVDSNAASYPIDDTEVSFGQTDGHLQFPDDPFLGELHCSVVKEERGAALVDHGSPCGTWLRLRAGDVVAYGSELLVGQTRIRVEQA